jgi:hypothetical protein
MEDEWFKYRKQEIGARFSWEMALNVGLYAWLDNM